LSWQQRVSLIAIMMFSVAIERPPLATKIFVVVIEGSTNSNHIDKCGNREAICSNQISIVAIDGLLIATT
jgi:hypothetical protein